MIIKANKTRQDNKKVYFLYGHKQIQQQNIKQLSTSIQQELIKFIHYHIMTNTYLICILTILLLNNTMSQQPQTISSADFVFGATYTKSYMWDNFIGLSLQFNNIQNIMNSTLYQAYHLNSNIKGDWMNNFAVSLKTPLGHKYNCSAIAAYSNQTVVCTFQTQGNKTYWSVLGEFIWNTVNQPNWCIGYDMQAVNLTHPAHQQVFYNWLYQVYRSTYYAMFCTQIVDYGDKMVERGYKTQYLPANFTKDIQKANYVLYSIGHSGPGITDQASVNWLLNIQAFHKVSMYGHYTVRCIIFRDPTKMTLQGILSDNATKYYLQKRFAVNQTYYYSDFSKLWLGITDVKLTTGNGVDGLTNTFAAALWAVDMALEFCLMNGWEIDFNHQVRDGNFQSVLGPAPTFKPSALYYGLLFLTIIRDGTPQIILPATKGIISSKIKVYGFTTGDRFKVLLLNKDTNVSLNGTVLIKSQLTGSLRCISMQAPSLTSKDGITITGYNFVGGNATVKGTYTQSFVQYDYAAEGYQVPIKYAQAVLCETLDSIFNWPKGKAKYGKNTIFSILFLVVFLVALF